MLIYHIITIESLKDYNTDLGICSPKALYDLDKDLFMKTSYQNYLERTALYLHKTKSKISAEDIIDFLDNAPIRKNKGFNSQTIFCVFLSYSKFPKKLQKMLIPCVQLSIDNKHLKKYKPKLLMYGSAKDISWEEIEDPKFIDWVEATSENPTNNTRIYSRVPHLALISAYQIPKKHIDDELLIKK